MEEKKVSGVGEGADEVKVGFADISVSLTIVRNSFVTIEGEVRKFPEFEKILRGALSKWKYLYDLILKLADQFNRINKTSISKKEQEELWKLDDLANNARADLLAEEINYKIIIRTTVSPSMNVDGMDTLMKNLVEISETLVTIIRSKVIWFEMRQRAESSRRLEYLTAALMFLTGVLAVLTFLPFVIP